MKKILEKEKQNSQKYLDIAGVIFVIIDANLNTRLINKKGCEILGHENDKEIIGKNWIDNFIPPKARSQVRDCFTKLIKGDIQQLEYFENPIITKDGKERIIAWHNTVIRNERNQIVATLSSGADITERKHVQEALKESEEKFRTVTQISPVGIFRTNTKGSCLYVNDRWCEIAGLSAKKAKGKGWIKSIHPQDKDKVLEIFYHTKERDVCFKLEYRIIRQDGSTRWVIGQGTAERNLEGQLSGFVGTITDITDRKETEKALKESEEKFRAISQAASDSIVLMDNDGKTIFCNKATEDMLGYSKDELIGKEFHLYAALKKDYKEYKKHIALFAKTGQGVAINKTLELVARKKGGEVFPVELSVSAVKLKGKWHAIGIIRNITERKLAEETMEKSREFYLTLFDEFPVLVWRSGIDTKFDYFNRTWIAFTGRSMEQEIGEGWTKGVHSDDLKQVMQTYIRAFKIRKPFSTEYRLRRYDGEYRWVINYGRPFFDLDGNFGGYIGTCYDITERKKHEEQLAHMAAHDPLTGLPNRRLLEETLKRAVAHARRGTPSVLLFLDIDNFKSVNDSLGHNAGDQALIILSQLFQKNLRTEDLLARIGGDEFAVLLEQTNVDRAQVVAERIRRTIEQSTIVIGKHEFKLGVSIGLIPIDGQLDPWESMANADEAMYRAKEEGRNRVVQYQSS